MIASQRPSDDGVASGERVRIGVVEVAWEA